MEIEQGKIGGLMLEEATAKIKQMNNRTLINFLKQRQCQKEPSSLHIVAIEEFKDRQAREFAMFWQGKKFKDEPIDNILNEV